MGCMRELRFATQQDRRKVYREIMRMARLLPLPLPMTPATKAQLRVV